MDGEQQRYTYTFTVFTPTYNRASTLPRGYQSLCAQTFRDFEWLIVDDGSTDGTEELVRSWQEEGRFPIRYIYQENQGKPAAFNRGVQEARGALFLPLDSDDAFVAQALERFKHHWDSIPNAERHRFSAVTALCVDQYGRLISEKFPYDPTDSDSLEMVYKFKPKGDEWGFHRTDVLRRFPFPVTSAVRHVPEGIVWNAIAREFKTRFVNEPLLICWRDEPGRADHLSKHTPYTRSAAGQVLWAQFVLNQDIDWFGHAPRLFLIQAAYYSRFSFHAGKNLLEQLNALNNLRARLLWIVTMPVGFLAYCADRTGMTGRIKRMVS